jgi:hypothetical protein
MDLRLIIDHLLKCERRIRAIYLTLSQRPDFSAEARDFWSGMAEDENHHREFYEQTAGLLNFVKTPFPLGDAAFRRVEQTIADAESAIRQPGFGMDDALRLALTLESSELQLLEKKWLEGLDPSVHVLRHDQIPQEEDHLKRLLNATHRFSTDEELHMQADEMWAVYQLSQVDGETE